jgi:hypothetical protein
MLQAVRKAEAARKIALANGPSDVPPINLPPKPKSTAKGRELEVLNLLALLVVLVMSPPITVPPKPKSTPEGRELAVLSLLALLVQKYS